MIYFVHGPDALLVRQHVRQLREQIDPTGSNTTRLDGRTTSAAKIAPMVATPGFFGDGRLIIVDDLFGVRTKKGKGSDAPEDADSADFADASSDATNLLMQVVAPNSLIVVEPTLSSVPAAVKKRAPSLEIRSGVPPRGNELVSWVSEQASDAGAAIDRRAATQLLDLLVPATWRLAPSNPRYDTPPDLDAIQQEVRKLAAYSHPNAITDADVRAMTSAAVADQLFPFLSALFGGEASEAVRLLSDALDRGDDQFRLVAQVMQQAELAAPLESARGKNPEAVGVDLAVPNPRRMSAIERSSRVHQVTPIHGAIVAADRDQKRGRLRTAEDVLFAVIAASVKQKRTRR